MLGGQRLGGLFEEGGVGGVVGHCAIVRGCYLKAKGGAVGLVNKWARVDGGCPCDIARDGFVCAR